MGELRADRWLHLVGTPTFLRPISRIEHDWWRPIVTLALILVIGIFLGLVGYLVIGLINTWLIQVLLLGEAPSWPPNIIAAATTSHIQCADCLMGGVTEAVMLAVMFAIWTAAVLLAAVALNHRPAMTWITAAPRFRWRMFWAGLVLFGLALAAFASLPEALHGWPDRPVFLKADETVRVRVGYTVIMLLSLPIMAAFEEILCRGWLLQVSGAFTHSLPAILLFNSILFALMHVDTDPVHNLSRLVLGMALSWAALRTGGLEIGIGMHSANNIVILMLAQTLQQKEIPGAAGPLAVAVNLSVSLMAIAVVELVARWRPLRAWSGLDLDSTSQLIHRPNATFAAP
jgi:membrane protease YdiL (CAAX protease family)